ncbi:MAG: hypothetical protein JWP69_1975 [Flaviaesturariibacter sp.]|nr:hypothetical protein [Flaviaesturariibacter sp.]
MSLILKYCISWFIICAPQIVFSQLGSNKKSHSDSALQAKAKDIANLLEEKKLSSLLKSLKKGDKIKNNSISKQLSEIASSIQPLKATTKRLVQVSYKNYQDSFNICQVRYYNEQGTFYLYELIFLKEDPTFRIAEVFIKNVDILARDRKKIQEYRVKNPNIILPPQSLPPGIYIKEHN